MPRDKTSSLPYVPFLSPYPQLLPAAEIHKPAKRSAGSFRRHPTPGAPPAGGSPLSVSKIHGRNSPTVGGTRGTQSVEAPSDSLPFRPRTPVETLRYKLTNRSPIPSRPASPLHQNLRGDHHPADITTPDGKRILVRTLNPDLPPLVQYVPPGQIRNARALHRAQDGYSSSRSRSSSPVKGGRARLEKTMAELNRKAKQHK
ncbi:hypothetical protein PLEOSDRAFT_1098521 [Pleurotus ostreatus PC15]|uniref:Uncharacterized protein n=1 Tax=Pleurotus ostreatus (strain PC15) TaxID=1137138 RepID=A0A067P9E4_PLEO1|nr:hypothetical protein PLEOSDRAFT_1098521 [Pleurotus ostreatus PC15]